MLAVVLSSLLAWQDPHPPQPSPQPVDPPKPASPAAPAAETVPVALWDDKTAKAAVDEFQQLLQGSPSMAQKTRALDGLAAGSHKLLVKPLARVVETEKLVLVRKRAAALLGQQPKDDSTPAIRKLLKSSRVASAPQVVAELVRALARTGYEPALWKEIDGLFERDYAADRVPIQEAVLELVILHEERQALPLLLRNLDEPAPENVDDASNPPQEYREARWKAWSTWRGKVREALFAVTGQRFSTAAEAKAWLQQNPLR